MMTICLLPSANSWAWWMGLNMGGRVEVLVAALIFNVDSASDIASICVPILSILLHTSEGGFAYLWCFIGSLKSTYCWWNLCWASVLMLPVGKVQLRSKGTCCTSKVGNRIILFVSGRPITHERRKHAAVVQRILYNYQIMLCFSVPEQSTEPRQALYAVTETCW